MSIKNHENLAKQKPYEILSYFSELLNQKKSNKNNNEDQTKTVNSYLAFKCGDWRFLVDLDYVVSVETDLGVISPLPLTPHWLLGLASLRGDIYSVSDFRRFLGISTTKQVGGQYYLAFKKEDQRYMLRVDAIFGLRQCCLNEYQDEKNDWIDGQGSADGEKWLKMNVDKLLVNPVFSYKSNEFIY